MYCLSDKSFQISKINKNKSVPIISSYYLMCLYDSRHCAVMSRNCTSKLKHHNYWKRFQDGVPARVKGIHVVNQPVIFNVVFNFFKPFLREKLRSRVSLTFRILGSKCVLSKTRRVGLHSAPVAQIINK